MKFCAVGPTTNYQDKADRNNLAKKITTADNKQTETFSNYILCLMKGCVVQYINKRIEMSCREFKKYKLLFCHLQETLKSKFVHL